MKSERFMLSAAAYVTPPSGAITKLAAMTSQNLVDLVEYLLTLKG